MLGHFNSIKDLCVSPLVDGNQRYLASGSQDQNLRIWKMQPLLKLEEDKDEDWSKKF